MAMAAVDLNDYYYFVHVVEKGSFTRAAEALGIPKSRLSRHVARLEERLDVVLIQRTTRQSRITELGEVFYQHAKAAVDEAELAETALKRKKNAVAGNVSLSCSVGLAQFALKELLVRFMTDNPLVSVSQQVTNENVDLVATGVDLSIRGHKDPLPDSTLVQRELAIVEWNLFASPDYLAAGSPIGSPADISAHHLLAVGWRGSSNLLRLQHQSGAEESIETRPRLNSEDMTTLKEAACSGLGVVALPAYTCRRELASGELVRVLPEWHAGEARLSLLMPRRRGSRAPVLALQSFLQSELARSLEMP